MNDQGPKASLSEGAFGRGQWYIVLSFNFPVKLSTQKINGRNKPYEKIHQDLRLDSRWSHSERLCEPLAPMMGRFTYRRVLDNDK